ASACRPARLPRRGSFRTPRGAPVVRLGGSGLAIGCAGPQGHAAPEGGPGMIQELLPQAERIGAILKARGETVSVAESSTAGLISAALLAVGGASAYFMGAAVVYTRASRSELLRVTEAEFAAMTGITPSTEPYALLFARKIKERLDTTWSIGETGTAGPTGSRYGHAPGHSCLAGIGRRPRPCPCRVVGSAKTARWQGASSSPASFRRA